MKIIRYFFFKVYKFSLSNGENYSGWAFGFVAIFLVANCITLNDAIQLIFKIDINAFGVSSIVLQTISVLSFTFWYLIIKQTPKKILHEFKNASSKSKIIFNFYLIIYILLSIILFVYLENLVKGM